MCDRSGPRIFASDANVAKKVFCEDENFTGVKEVSRGCHTALTRTAYQMDAIFFQWTRARLHSPVPVRQRDVRVRFASKLDKESSWFKRIYAGWRVCCLRQT